MQVIFFDKARSFLKRYQDILMIGCFVLIVLVFFYKTVCFLKLPIPSDDLVGLYHPWRDAYAHTFQNGVPYKNFLITDPIRQQIPWRKQVIDAFKTGHMPLWDATSFSGVPLLGNIQSGALYPLNVLFFVFPFEIAWTILIISQPLLGGIFLYLFLRHKKILALGALTGAVCFSLSGFSISWLTWGTIGSTLLWLPLMLLSFEKIHGGKRKGLWRLLFIFSIVSSFFAGHIQVFFYSILLFCLYALWTHRGMKIKKIYLMHILTPLLVIALTFPVWTRFISFYMTSARSGGTNWETEGFFIPLRHLIQFVVPDFFGNPTTLNYWGTWNYGELVGYIGVIGLIFAIIGLSKATMFWGVNIALCLLFAINSPIARLPYRLHIPFLSSLQPTRLLSIVDFSLSILAAYGISEVLKNNKKKQFMTAIVMVGIVLLGAWISVLKPYIPVENVSVAKHNLILPTALYGVMFCISIVLLWMKSSWKTVRVIVCLGIVGLLSFELIRFGWKFTPFTDRSYFFPKTEIIEQLQQIKKPFRVLATDDRLIPPNVLGFYNIETVSGYDPIYQSRYEEYIAAMERGEPNITPPFGFNRIISPKTITSPLLPLLNVHYILSMDTITSPLVRLLREEGTTKLYSVAQKVPRAYFAEQFFFEKSKEDVMKRLYSKEFIPGKSAVIEDEGFIVGEGFKEDTVDITSYEGDRMVLQTASKNARFLVIGNMMDSHWEVLIDKKKTNIVRVNYLFFGCIVPDGTHEVAVQYK